MAYRFIVVIIFCFGNLFSQIDLKIKIDSNKVLLATPFEVELVVEYSKNYQIQFSKIEKQTSDYEILKEDEVKEIEKNDKKFSLKKLQLIVFKLDSVTISPFKINYLKPNDSTKYSLSSDSLKLIIIAQKSDSATTYKDIKPPLTVPLEWSDIAIYGVYILVTIGIIYLIYWYFKKKKKKIVEEVREVKIPPDVDALQKLEEIEKENLLLNGQVKLFYSKVSDVLRIYIEKRFNFPAAEQTTSEILEELNIRILNKSLINAIQDFLTTADLVKFAKYIPQINESEKVIPKAKDVVLNTTPKFVEIEQNAN